MRVVDLFAGCGGMSLGFKNAGFDVKAAFEYWAVAAECYQTNLHVPVFVQDLSNIDEASKRVKGFAPDTIIGGPPCQDFSCAGRRIESTRAELTVSFAEIVALVRPMCFVMENVPNAVKSAAFAEALKIFRDAGYGVTQAILHAEYFGVPQKRRRMFCFGILNGKDNDNLILNSIESLKSKEPTTMRTYFRDSLDFKYFYSHPRSYKRRAIFSTDEPAPTVRGCHRVMSSTYPWHPKDACTDRTKIHSLTLEDRAAIQTFPQNFTWIGTKNEINQMIGNAVPVKLAEATAKAVKLTLEQ